VLLVVDVALAGAVVELRLTAFGLQLRESEVAHFGGTLKGQLRVELREDFIPLSGDLFVLACNATESRQEQVTDCC
jgi:hypothetical protein